MSLFLIELVHRIKNPLVSVKTFTQLLREKFNDAEFREHFYRIVTEDIEKIDSVLNGLLSYIKINTPIEKKDTVHFILEDVLKKHEIQLEDKKIKIFKKFEKDLPETIVHDEQLRYILNSLLQYAIPSIPPNGSIGFLTKSFDLPTQTADDKKLLQKDGRYIEILIVFTGYKKPVEQFETVLGIPAVQKEEAIELELRFIKEIIQKNQGMMKFEVNEKKPRTLISLKFPIERRKVIYYQPVECLRKGDDGRRGEKVRSVLIVDDEVGARESLKMILKNDYEVFLAKDAEEAFLQIKEHSPDVILLDIILPDLDGLKVLEKIKQSDPDIIVIMITATKTVKTAVEAMKLGAYDYVTKPFDIDELASDYQPVFIHQGPGARGEIPSRRNG